MRTTSTTVGDDESLIYKSMIDGAMYGKRGVVHIDLDTTHFHKCHRKSTRKNNASSVIASSEFWPQHVRANSARINCVYKHARSMEEEKKKKQQRCNHHWTHWYRRWNSQIGWIQQIKCDTIHKATMVIQIMHYDDTCYILIRHIFSRYSFTQ